MAPISRNEVAVVVPGYNRAQFTSDEETSLQHLQYFLERYDKFFVMPESLKFERPGFSIQRFPDIYFGSAIANTRLMLSPAFYSAFRQYRYILIYQLDALVFSDSLLEWCAEGFDYIGAPWVKSLDTPWVCTPRVGNGGFSLRRVESFLRVFSSKAYWIDPEVYWQRISGDMPWYSQPAHLPRKWVKYIKMFNGVKREVAQWHLRSDGTKNEDHFWADRARHYDPHFKVAPFEAGLRFAFEADPRRCFEMTNRTLPFGCHAWARYDRSFWEPYLLQTK